VTHSNRVGRRHRIVGFIAAVVALLPAATSGQTVPTFHYKFEANTYTLVGSDPAIGRTTEIPVVVVPVSLSFASSRQPPLDGTADVAALLRSPVFTAFSFGGQGDLQYGDAMLRATLPHAQNWHTILAKSDVIKTVHIAVPAAFGYVLSSKASGRLLGIADIEYVQRELFKQVPKQNGKLVIAVTHNAAYYAEGDATICCLWGTHGSDAATGNSFVLASYLSAAPSVVQDQDVQPLTEQLGEFINDPLHDPLIRQGKGHMPGNQLPRWIRPSTMRPGDQGRCGGDRVASAYFLLEPTDTNRKNNLPYSSAFVAKNGTAEYHVQNVALLAWYLGSAGKAGKVFSFPDPGVLTAPAEACPARSSAAEAEDSFRSQVRPAPVLSSGNGHALIGYWTGSQRNGKSFPLHEVSPQWDVIIVAFATPDHNAREGTLRFQVPRGNDPEEFKRHIAQLKRQGKKILISLGGGGEYFTLDDSRHTPNFVSSVSAIVKEHGFDGVDIDFETPSLMLASGDTDFRHPTTPSIINLIVGLRKLKQALGPSFMISLVPEGPQIPAGHVTYGGQLGSYLPLAYGLRDILSFMDVQDYNTPPLEGLDGEIYQAGTVDYHAAITELVLHGFSVGGDTAQVFPALPQNQVAVGFLTGETSPDIVEQTMRYIITGQRPPEATYSLRKAEGYPGMIGAMFWTIDADASEFYRFSNVVGPELHGFPGSR
jgi:chitinase